MAVEELLVQYVKLVDGKPVEPPINKDNIINYNMNIEALIADGYKILVPAEVPGSEEIRMYHFEYEEKAETIDEIVVFDETQQEAEARKARVERERLDALTLTPADVERALYKAKEMDFEDLKALIATQLPNIDTKALSIEFRAKDFYRGATIDVENPDPEATEPLKVRLIDTIGALLGYTSQDMDYLFEHKELPVLDNEE